MNLVNFRGLDCYLSCIISIADYWGLEYYKSFYNTWSETEFKYNSDHSCYTSERIISNLKIQGLGLVQLDLLNNDYISQTLYSSCCEDFFVIGMDAFNIPWSPIYQIMHDSHYFFITKKSNDTFICFDPSYGKSDMILTISYMILHTLNLIHIINVRGTEIRTDINSEAQKIIDNHSYLYKRISSQITDCNYEGKKDAISIAKYIDALIKNRYLFEFYIDKFKYDPIFNSDLFNEWTSIKNGLFKAFLIKSNKDLLIHINKQLNHITDSEIIIAETLTK